MQGQHGALAEPDDCQRRGRQIVAHEFEIKEPLQHRRRMTDAVPTLVDVARRQRKPLPAGRHLAAGIRRVRGDEGGVRQQALPGAPDFDQVVAVGTVAMQKYHKLARRAAVARLKSWSIKIWSIKIWPIKTWSTKTWFTKNRTIWFSG